VLRGLSSLVRPGAIDTIVVLADPSQRHAVAPWVREFAGKRIWVVSPDEAPEWGLEDGRAQHRLAKDLSGISQQVRMMPAVDLMVSLLPSDLLPADAEDQLAVFSSLFRYVRKGGAYVVDRRAAGSGPEGFGRWLSLLAAAEDRATEECSRAETELSSSVGTVAASRDLVVVTKRLRHYVKLSESQVSRILPAREPDVDFHTLESRRGGEFASRARVVSHQGGPQDETFPEVIEYPDLTVRQYDGKIALAGATLMYAGHTVLPDSFRWHLASNPSNPHLKSVSRRFARVDSAYRPHRTLEGVYYQLDSAYPQHFGHVMTEVVSRLWGWDVAKRENPGLKAVFHLKSHSRRNPSLERTLFTAYGIDESDIVWVDDPVWVRSAVSASPMWHNATPHYAHPGIVETWDRLAAGLARDPARSPHERIFVSRGPGAKHRVCRNIDEVEEFFRSRGFHVVYPERLPLAEQVAVFRDARVVAGFGGSAMFNLMFAKSVETVIVLNHQAYTARNEHLFTTLTGGDVHYFWSRPDVDHPEGGWSAQAFAAAWEFDFARNGADLASVVADS
jgi:capsular polysaccharide biosynthesis protein